MIRACECDCHERNGENKQIKEITEYCVVLQEEVNVLKQMIKNVQSILDLSTIEKIEASRKFGGFNGLFPRSRNINLETPRYSNNSIEISRLSTIVEESSTNVAEFLKNVSQRRGESASSHSLGDNSSDSGSRGKRQPYVKLTPVIVGDKGKTDSILDLTSTSMFKAHSKELNYSTNNQNSGSLELSRSQPYVKLKRMKLTDTSSSIKEISSIDSPSKPADDKSTLMSSLQLMPAPTSTSTPNSSGTRLRLRVSPLTQTSVNINTRKRSSNPLTPTLKTKQLVSVIDRRSGEFKENQRRPARKAKPKNLREQNLKKKIRRE